MHLRLSHSVFVGMFVSVAALTRSISSTAFHSTTPKVLQKKNQYGPLNRHYFSKATATTCRTTRKNHLALSFSSSSNLPFRGNNNNNRNAFIHRWQKNASSCLPNLRMTATTATSSSITSSTTEQLKGIDWIRSNIVQVLNDSFDYKEVARNVATAKLGPKKKKKKKKKKKTNGDDANAEAAAAAEDEKDGPPPLSQEEKDAIVNEAVENALPFGWNDVMVTPATKLEFGDYQCNAAMGLAKNVGMSPR